VCRFDPTATRTPGPRRQDRDDPSQRLRRARSRRQREIARHNPLLSTDGAPSRTALTSSRFTDKKGAGALRGHPQGSNRQPRPRSAHVPARGRPRRFGLESEIKKLPAPRDDVRRDEVAGGIAKALAARTFGARYVRTLIDQGRFARGLPRAPPSRSSPDRADADAFDVTPTTWSPTMPSSTTNGKQNPSDDHDPHDPNPTTTPTSDAVATMSLAESCTLLDCITPQASWTRGRRRPSPKRVPLSPSDALMREELSVQLEARAKAALRRSLIFPLTSLDAYDFDYPKTIDKDVVMRAASLDFVKERTNVVFVGPSGVRQGLTSPTPSDISPVCAAIALASFSPQTWSTTLVAAQAKNGLHRRLNAYAPPSCLIIDELGLPVVRRSRRPTFLYQVFNRRYQRASTVVTTNRPSGLGKLVPQLRRRHYQWGIRLKPLGRTIILFIMLIRPTHHLTTGVYEGVS